MKGIASLAKNLSVLLPSNVTNMYNPLLIPTILAIVSTATASRIQVRQCTGPNVNAATVSLVKEFEGFVPSPAPDPIGLPTVGYGHLCQTSGCSEVPYAFPLTESTASQLLATDLKVYHTLSLSLSPCHHTTLQRRSVY